MGAISAPISIRGHSIALSACAGVSAVVPSDAGEVSSLRYASDALAEARRHSANSVVVCEAADRNRVDQRASIGRELFDALAMGRLRIACQPIVDLEDSEVIALEALMRWRTDDGRDISPGEFIPLAERNGVIGPVGRWGIDEAIRIASTLKSTPDSKRRLTMTVNLSPTQFADPELVGRVEQALVAHHLPPRLLAFEITESVAVDLARADKRIRSLRSLGCLVGIDDFGVGQSCPSYLATLPIDFIKIDLSFVRAMDSDPRALRIVQSIVEMSYDLGLITVAEGIETQSQRDTLREMGCIFGQGYLFGRPKIY